MTGPILELMYATGVRVAEFTTLNLGHIDFKNSLIRVTGKRRKERIVPFGDPALEALKNYLDVRDGLLEGRQFPNESRRRFFLITRARE